MAIKLAITPEEDEGRIAIRAEGGTINEAFYLGRRDADGIVRTVRETTDASKVWVRDPNGARKNYFTRPRFELVTAAQTLSRNLFRNPFAVPKAEPVAGTIRTNLARNPSFEIEGAAIAEPGGGTVALTQLFGAAQSGGAYLRATWSKASTVGNNTTGIFSNTFTSTPGKTYTVSAYVRSSHLRFFKVQVRWNTATQLFTQAALGPQHQVRAYHATENPGWWRISATVTAPVGTVAGVACFFLDPTSSSRFNAGEWMEADSVLIEEAATLQPYFDGSNDGPVSTTEGATGSDWVGDAHNSSSRLYYREVHELFGRNASPRDFVGRVGIVSNGDSNDTSITLGTGDAGALRSGLLAGRTYTVAATLQLTGPQTGDLHARARTIAAFTRVGSATAVVTSSSQMDNVAKTERLSVTFSVPDGATEAYVRIYSGAAKGGPVLTVRDITLVEGDVAMPAFTGKSGPVDDVTYGWENSTAYPDGTVGEAVMTAPAPAGGFLSYGVHTVVSTDWKAGGTYSMRQIPSSMMEESFTAAPAAVVALEAGKSYMMRVEQYQSEVMTGTLSPNARRLRITGTGMNQIVSDQPANAVGRRTLVFRFTIPAGASNIRIEFVHGGTFGAGDLFWDLVLVTEAPYSGNYFDGIVANPLLGGWDGAAHASTSSRYSDTLPITVYDYEAQQGSTVEYVLLDQQRGVVAQSSVAVDLPNWGTWIKDPLRPYLNVKVALNSEGSSTHSANRVLLQPRGSRNVIAQWDARSAPHGSMKFLTLDREDRQKLLDLIEQTGVALVDAPYDFDVFARYVSLGDIVSSRPVDGRLSASARLWEMEVDEVIPPVGETVGMAATYENVSLSFSSYLALSASVANYRDLVAGGWA